MTLSLKRSHSAVFNEQQQQTQAIEHHSIGENDFLGTIQVIVFWLYRSMEYVQRGKCTLILSLIGLLGRVE